MNRYTFIIFFLIISISTPFSMCAAKAKVPVSYKKIGWIDLKIHVFNPPDFQKTDKRPAIVFFSGVNWQEGSPLQFIPQCKYLASRDMVAFAAEVRTAKKHKSSPADAVADGKSAIRWIRQHASVLGVDPDKLVAAGGDSGGHIAAATGSVKKFVDPQDDLSISSIPNALVLFNPGIDNGPGAYGHTFVKDYWQDISPLHNIDSNTPPTLILLSSDDDHPAVSSAQKYRNFLEKAGVRCDLMMYANEAQAFFNKARFFETLIQVDRFLTSLGFLHGEPTLKKDIFLKYR